MYYLLYEITNLVNGKTYIGQHITKNIGDGYMGSGKLIVAAIKKYGKENFKKEILLYAKNEIALNFFERALVTPEFCELNTNYNLREGGGSKGRMSKESIFKCHNTRKLNGTNRVSSEHKAKISATMKGRKLSSDWKAKISSALKGKKKTSEHIANLSAARTGKKCSFETKMKISLAGKGRKKPPRTPETIVKMLETKKRNGTTNKGKKYKTKPHK
jgi:NUMOD3 motif